MLNYASGGGIATLKVELTEGALLIHLAEPWTVDLSEVVVLEDTSEFALSELSRMVEKDRWWLNFDEKKAVQLMRSFNAHEQSQFLNSGALIESVQYYLNKKQWGAAISNWKSTSLEDKLALIANEKGGRADYYHLREMVFYSPDKSDFDCEKYLDGKILQLNTEEEYACFFKDLGKSKEEANFVPAIYMRAHLRKNLTN